MVSVRPSVRPMKELNHFSSYCLDVDHCTTQVLYSLIKLRRNSCMSFQMIIAVPVNFFLFSFALGVVKEFQTHTFFTLGYSKLGPQQRALLVVNQRKVTRKLKNCTQNLNLVQEVANKSDRNQKAAHIVAKPDSLQLAVRMHRYGSLININLSEGKVLKPIYLFNQLPQRTQRKSQKDKKFSLSFLFYLTSLLKSGFSSLQEIAKVINIVLL